MTRSINEWKEEMAAAVNTKYPDQWSQERRLENTQNELQDVIDALKFEKGEIQAKDEKDYHRLKSVEERMGGVLANLFVLAKQRGSDLEKVLEEALDWFRDHSKKGSSEK